MKKSDFRASKSLINKRLILLSSIFVVSLAIFSVFVWIASDVILFAPPTQIFLNWQDNSNNENFFIVERSTDFMFSNNVVEVCNTPSDLTYCSGGLLSSLSSNTPYFFRVKACLSDRGIICSPWSSVASVTTPVQSLCVIGQKRSCFTGPVGSIGVGVCLSGLETCADIGHESGQWSGICVGQVVPSTEQCGTLDTNDFDCDGKTNCADPDCSSNVACIPVPTCGNGVVNVNEFCNEPGLFCSDGMTCNTLNCQCQNEVTEGGSSGGSSGGRSGVVSGGSGNTGVGSGNVQPPSSPESNKGILAPNVPIVLTPTNSSPKLSLFDSLKALFGTGKLRVVYWLIVLILGTSILIIGVLILRTLRQRSRLIGLVNSSQNILAKLNNYPPSGYGGSGGYN